MLTIDFEPPEDLGTCPDCGGQTTELTRFVSSDDEPFAVYYARYVEGHEKREVIATVSVGDWSEESPPDGRVAFALRLWTTPEQGNVSVLDAADSPWRDVEVIGRTLDRQEALAHPRLADVFHVTDHIFDEDVPIREYLSGESLPVQ